MMNVFLSPAPLFHPIFPDFQCFQSCFVVVNDEFVSLVWSHTTVSEFTTLAAHFLRCSRSSSVHSIVVLATVLLLALQTHTPIEARLMLLLRRCV